MEEEMAEEELDSVYPEIEELEEVGYIYKDEGRLKGVLREWKLPECKHREDGNIEEGQICILSEHPCYTDASNYIDCICLLGAGLCPKGKEFNEIKEDDLTDALKANEKRKLEI